MNQFIENDFSWTRGPLEQFFRFTKKPKELRIKDSATIPFIPMELVPEKGQTNTPYNLKKYDDVTSGTYFEDGDILVAKITPSFENGKQGIANLKGAGFGYATTEVIPIHEIKELSNRYYLFYYLLDPLLRNELASKMEGSTGRKRIRDHLLKELIIDIPKLSEQLRIAAILHKLQKAIEIEDKLIQTTRELKKSTMKQLFTHGLRGEKLKETEIGLVPESWEIKILDDIFENHDGKRIPVKQSDRQQGEYPYYGASGIVDWVSGYLFNGDYLLVAEDGENLSTRKLPIAFIARGKFWVNNHAHALKIRKGSLKFFEQLITQMEIKYYLTGMTRPKLNKGLLMKMKISCPSEGEQTEIAHILQTIDQKIEIHEKKKSALQDLFKTMLHKLMTAEIRVHDLEIDTSGVV
jgi:type I restriction enzyme S subunit